MAQGHEVVTLISSQQCSFRYTKLSSQWIWIEAHALESKHKHIWYCSGSILLSEFVYLLDHL